MCAESAFGGFATRCELHLISVAQLFCHTSLAKKDHWCAPLIHFRVIANHAFSII